VANNLNFTGPKTLNNTSGMPQMISALTGWVKTIIYGFITQVIGTDGDRQSTVEYKSFQGTIQPLSVRSLSLKPEGQRSWSWKQIHSYSGDLNLRTQDLITIDNIQYKVMGVLNYSLNGFMEYHIVTDYVEQP
jgi:hypothetical protein